MLVTRGTSGGLIDDNGLFIIPSIVSISIPSTPGLEAVSSRLLPSPPLPRMPVTSLMKLIVWLYFI